VRSLASGAAIVLALAFYLELAWPPFYAFPKPQPFTGDQWYQPYAGHHGGGLVANFHAHARVWGGLTFGEVSREELYAMYAERGYDVIGISDYMSIAPKQAEDALYLSAYEHGYTIGRHHQTVIGAERVDWFDYPFGGSVRHKQHVIDELRPDAAFLILNHLGKAGAYSLEDLATLTGYDAIEVSSKYGVSQAWWDAALSAGRPIWGTASDDGHTQRSKRSHLGIGAIVIHAEARTPEAVLRALRGGRFHALRMRRNEAPIALLRSEIEDGALVVRVGERADAIRFIGAHGALRHEAHGVDEARHRPSADDPYLRVEVDAHGAQLFLNPVLRWDGVALPAPRAEPLPLPTWALRAFGALLLALVVRFSVWFARVGRGTARSPGPERAPRPEASPGSEGSAPLS
jgi:hypothetical protein